MKIERARTGKRYTTKVIAQGGHTTVGRSLWWSMEKKEGGQSFTVSHHDMESSETHHIELSSDDVLMILRSVMDPDKGYPALEVFQQQIRDTVSAR